MDMIRVGGFLAELRKERGLTQEQLGERLGVTNKTISRWETGTYLAPADMLLQLSDLYDVSINELLYGKRLSESEYREAAEKNLKETISESRFTVKERIDFFKKKWLKEHITMMALMGCIVVALFIYGIVFSKVLICGVAVILLIVFHCIRYNKMMAYVEDHVYVRAGR